MPTLNCSQEESDRLHSLVPGLHEKDADKKIGHVNDHLETLSMDEPDTDDMSLLSIAGVDTTDLSRADAKAKVKELRDAWASDYAATIKANEALTAQVAELSANRPTLDLARTDDKFAGEYKSLYIRKADLAVSEGKMTPVQCKAFKEALTSDPVLMLSREDESSDRAADLMLSLFTEKMIPIGDVKTSVQQLSRVTPDDKPDGKLDANAPHPLMAHVEKLKA